MAVHYGFFELGIAETQELDFFPARTAEQVNIFGLYVAMEHARGVRCFQPCSDLLGKGTGTQGCERAILLDGFLQVSTVRVLHNDKGAAVASFVDALDLGHVGMLEVFQFVGTRLKKFDQVPVRG